LSFRLKAEATGYQIKISSKSRSRGFHISSKSRSRGFRISSKSRSRGFRLQAEDHGRIPGFQSGLKFVFASHQIGSIIDPWVMFAARRVPRSRPETQGERRRSAHVVSSGASISQHEGSSFA
jgi:hypothetical protein